jgi:hypothetical protein
MLHNHNGRYRRTFTALAIPAAAVAVSLGAVSAASAVATTAGFTASQTVSNRDDSGTNSNGTTNNWAKDSFTRTTTLFGHGIVANTYCPGIAIGACHFITGKITDKGTFTTVVGDAVPGQGSLNGAPAPLIGTAVTGPMAGALNYSFYANVPLTKASASNAPSSITGDTPSTGQWPEQFFPAGTQFWDSTGATGGNEYLGYGAWGWTYTASLGSDPACPNVSGRWIDASGNNSGANAVDGNILAPDAAHC